MFVRVFCVCFALSVVSKAQTEDRTNHSIDDSIPISKIGGLIATPREEAAKQKKVRVIGTISSVGDGIAARPQEIGNPNFCCVEDESGGIWVSIHRSRREKLLVDNDVLPKLKCGMKIEMEGRLAEGGYTPVVLPILIEVRGEGELPEVERTRLRRFLTGSEDARRVRVRGVVQTIAESKFRWLARIETGVGFFLAALPKKDRYKKERLLDAAVELTGVAAASRNWRRELVCPRLIVNRDEDVVILRPAPKDPFSVKTVALEQIGGYTPDGRPLHRRRIQGVVTYCEQQLVYVQHENAAIRIELHQSESLNIGQWVEVSGFIDTARYVAGLRGAVVRRLESVGDSPSQPQPVPISMEQIIANFPDDYSRKAKIRDCDGRLVHLSGTLLSFQEGIAPNPHRLEIDCGDSVSTALLVGPPTRLEPGTELKVTGIANLSFAPVGQNPNFAKPTRVDILLRNEDDITVLSRPSWWTAQRALWAFFIVAGIALAAFAWALTLRRSLSQRTDELAREMRKRRNVAIEFQAAVQERTRLAANLHDTVLQTMAGIAYQIEACGQLNGVSNHLETASRMIKHGQDDLRNTVWALHPLIEGTFADSVQQAAGRIALGHQTKIAVDCSEHFPELADFIAGNLLLVIREAIHNSVKHADAKNVDVQLDVMTGEERVYVSVTDDGKGFEVNKRRTSSDGHFGIEVMTQRIEQLGGSLVIESQPGVGTTVTVEIPVREFDPKIS